MKNLFSIFICAMIFSTLLGCAPKVVHKDWMAVGGSRSDATIKLAFTYDPIREKPEVSKQQALDLAVQKCRTWGYESAEPFGSSMENCAQMVPGPFGSVQCVKMNVMSEFQCTGKIPPDIENLSLPKKK